MNKKNRPSFNTVPHYIAEDYRCGQLNINQLRLLLWLRTIGTPYGKATTSLNDLKHDVFPDLDLKINTINSILLKLRQKQHIYFEPRQGKAGTFDVHLNHWLMPKGYKTLDKFFPEPRQWIDADDEAQPDDTFPQTKQSEAGQKLSESNQKLYEGKRQLVKHFSTKYAHLGIRTDHNDNDNKNEIENHDTLEKPFKGTLVRDFQPESREQDKCKEIAQDVGDAYINPLLNVLRKDGFRIIEKAYGLYREDKQNGKRIDNPPAYFYGIIKKLRNEL